MKIKNIKNSQIIGIINGIGEVKKKRLPVKIGFAINKNLGAMEGCVESFEAERKKILDKYCEKDDDGNLRINGKEYVLADRETYASEMRELLAIENEIQIHTVSMTEIEKCDSEKFDALSPDDLSLMEFMIEE